MSIAFDAQSYDSQFTHTHIGSIQRSQVWNYLERFVKELSDKNILELNCGTGEDAVFLATQGLTVLATDVSQEMLSIASKKIETKKLTGKVSVAQLDLNQVTNFKPDKKFDLIFSNFAGLNCMDENHFKDVLQCCHEWLNPDGRLVMVLFSKSCLWESFYFFVTLKWNKVFRRYSSPLELNRLKIWYYSPREIIRLSSVKWVVRKQKPIGLFTPPSYMETFFKNKTALLRIFKFLDSAFRFSFLSPFADHYLIDLRKQ